MNKSSGKQRILVLGAGFGGLHFCKQLKDAAVDITLIDRQNHHLFQPLIYQVATAGLSGTEVAQPIRQILSRQRNVTVLMDEVLGVDLRQRTVELREGGPLPSYDYLVLALGAVTNYFGHEEWEASASGLKSVDDATRIRHDVLLAFEEAESCLDESRRKALKTIVIIGGGPTGLEMAGALAELTRKVLKRDFRRIDPRQTRIILVEGGSRLLGNFPPPLSESARRQVEALGVEVRLNTRVSDIRLGQVRIGTEIIRAETVIWTAGVRASPITASLGVETDRTGRITVGPDLGIPGFPEVFAVGDIAVLRDGRGREVPGVAPAAQQMAAHAAGIVLREVSTGSSPGSRPRPAFVYRDRGTMATIGRSAAVAAVGRLHITGFSAWLAWLLVHLIFLIGFRNRMAVLLQWFYSYINYKRGARIITGMDRSFRVRNTTPPPRSRIERRMSEERRTATAARP